MKITQLLFVLAILGFFAVEADAQRRTTTRRPAAPRVVTSNTVSTPAAQAADMKAGAEKVSIQVKNVTKFIFILGSVAKGIEDLDKDTRANRAAKQANETNKREVIQAIRNLRAGLATLEVEFRTKDPLKKHLTVIQGITDLSGQSEDLALSGRFMDAGKPLLLVVEKLSDTLVALR
ncbi:MAG: hypothetical protein KF855_17480 [Acidobacteria bacterium]|nr:hypothetical protein [Acidobacteriota bacterium]